MPARNSQMLISQGRKRCKASTEAVNPLPVMEEPSGKAQSIKGLISADDAQTAPRGSPLKEGAVFTQPGTFQLLVHL